MFMEWQLKSEERVARLRDDSQSGGKPPGTPCVKGF
jgi:hypothetical protein